MKKISLISIAALCSAMIASAANAGPLSGTYTTGGDTTGTGPWTLTATDSTYSVLRFVLDTPVAFGDLSSVVVNYTANDGFYGIGGGSPRLVVVTDADNDTVEDGYFYIHFGPAGSFVDPSEGPASTGNLLSLTDWGRYDLSGIGGSAYTDRATALGAASGYSVLRLSLVVDSYGGNDRSFTVDGISAESAVPEAATWAMMIAGMGLAGAAMRRRKTAVSFA